MADRFRRMWGKKGAGKGLRLRDKLRLLIRNASVREKIVEMRRTLNRDVRYLETELGRFRAMEKNLTARLKKALVEGDKPIAGVLSNELVNLKRVIDVMDKIRAAFEQISMRLGLMLQVGDVATTIIEIKPAIRVIIPLVETMMPQFLNDVLQVDEFLDDIMNETEMNVGEALPTEPMSEEARQLLEALKLTVRHEEELGLPEGPSPAAPRARRVGGGF